MKLILLALLSLTISACASKRGPASVDKNDFEEGTNTEYYFTR